MSLIDKIKEFISECIRVLRVTKKPSNEEYKQIVKVSGLGILLIGFIGFLLQVVQVLFFNT